MYGNKNALAHFICGPLDDCSLEVYTTGKTLPGGDIDLPHGLLIAIASKAQYILPLENSPLGACVGVVSMIIWDDMSK